jgi:tetratricopeptide (TPR) repeat protein
MNEFDILLEKARELTEEGNEKEAIEIYHQLIKDVPDWSIPYYNLGLIYKYRNDWQKSFDLNLKSTELNSKDEGSWWNLGIAATALKNWQIARTAWNQFGLNLEINDEEVRTGKFHTPIRLNPDGDAEVVWAIRIDPARAIVNSIPLPQCKHRYGDLVLNDGAPVGTRMVDGQEFSVFNELEILQKSDYKTFSVFIYSESQKDLDKLIELLNDYELPNENWTTTIKMLCKQCSEGTPHEVHDKQLEEKTKEGEFQIGIASIDSQSIKEVLDKWKVITLCDYENLKLELE